jgi:predicted anti-sigma-YlaC factor YlaD
MMRSIPSDCATAREAASALADGELSELEAVQLGAHLRSCPDCEAFAASTAALAVRLRGADLEQPVLPVFVPRRRRPAFRLQTAAAAVALVAAAGSAFAVGHFVGSQTGGTATTISAKVSPDLPGRGEVLGMVRRTRLGRMAANDVIPV